MTEHDFKAALVFIDGIEMMYGTRTEYKAIQFALKLAHAVQSGEVSEGMIKLAYSEENIAWQSGYTNCQFYRKMTQKLMEELSDDV